MTSQQNDTENPVVMEYPLLYHVSYEMMGPGQTPIRTFTDPYTSLSMARQFMDNLPQLRRQTAEILTRRSPLGGPHSMYGYIVVEYSTTLQLMKNYGPACWTKARFHSVYPEPMEANTIMIELNTQQQQEHWKPKRPDMIYRIYRVEQDLAYVRGSG